MTEKGTEGATAILVVLFLGVLMAALDIAILGPVIPAIRETFSLSERQVSWVFSVWVLANLVSVPIMAKMADRYGRKTVYLLVTSVFAVGGIVVALSPGFGVLLFGRALQGMAAAGIFPVAGAVIGDSFAPEKRGRAFGILGSVFGVAFLIGPVLAGFVLMIGWRYLYLAFIPIALIVIVLGWRILPETKSKTDHPIDVLGLASLAGILLAVAYALSVLDTANLLDSVMSWRVINSFFVVVILVPVFLHAEKTAKDPVLRLDLFRNRQVAVACVIAVGAGVNEAAFIFFPTIAVLAFGVSMSKASFMLLPLMLAVAIGSPLAGRLLDRTGSKLIIVISNSLLVLGAFGMSANPESEGLFYLSSVLIGLGLAGLMGSALSYILIHEANKQERAISQGIITLFISIGQLMAVAMVGAVAASSSVELEGYKAAFAVIVAFTVISTAVSFLLKNRVEEQKVVFSTDKEDG